MVIVVSDAYWVCGYQLRNLLRVTYGGAFDCREGV